MKSLLFCWLNLSWHRGGATLPWLLFPGVDEADRQRYLVAHGQRGGANGFKMVWSNRIVGFSSHQHGNPGWGIMICIICDYVCIRCIHLYDMYIYISILHTVYPIAWWGYKSRGFVSFKKYCPVSWDDRSRSRRMRGQKRIAAAPKKVLGAHGQGKLRIRKMN